MLESTFSSLGPISPVATWREYRTSGNNVRVAAE